MLENYNIIANLQDWYSTDHGSHTPLQVEGDEPMMEPQTDVNTETRAQK